MHGKYLRLSTLAISICLVAASASAQESCSFEGSDKSCKGKETHSACSTVANGLCTSTGNVAQSCTCVARQPIIDPADVHPGLTKAQVFNDLATCCDGEVVSQPSWDMQSAIDERQDEKYYIVFERGLVVQVHHDLGIKSLSDTSELHLIGMDVAKNCKETAATLRADHILNLNSVWSQYVSPIDPADFSTELKISCRTQFGTRLIRAHKVGNTDVKIGITETTLGGAGPYTNR